MNCDPNNLAKLSSCIRCLSDAQLASVRTLLLCNWLNKISSVAPNAPTNPDITPLSTAANITVTWTDPNPIGSTNEVWRSTDGVTFALLTTVSGGTSTITDSSGLAVGGFYYYKIRSCNSGNCSAFSSVISCCNQYTSPNVAAISFPNLIRAFGTNVTSFMATGLAALTSVSLPALKQVDGKLDISNNPNLTTITLTALQTAAAVLLGSNKITGAFSLPALTSTAGQDLQIQSNTLMTSFSCPLLVTVGGIFSVSGCTGLTSVNFNSLQSTGNRLDFNGDTSLTTLSFPVLVSTGNDGIIEVNVSNSTLLASWSAPNWLPSNAGMSLLFTGCALNVASVNQVLARGVAAATTSEDYELAGGTNAAPAGQGAVDKATLITAGNTVNTN